MTAVLEWRRCPGGAGPSDRCLRGQPSGAPLRLSLVSSFLFVQLILCRRLSPLGNGQLVPSYASSPPCEQLSRSQPPRSGIDHVLASSVSMMTFSFLSASSFSTYCLLFHDDPLTILLDSQSSAAHPGHPPPTNPSPRPIVEDFGMVRREK